MCGVSKLSNRTRPFIMQTVATETRGRREKGRIKVLARCAFGFTAFAFTAHSVRDQSATQPAPRHSSTLHRQPLCCISCRSACRLAGCRNCLHFMSCCCCCCCCCSRFPSCVLFHLCRRCSRCLHCCWSCFTMCCLSKLRRSCCCLLSLSMLCRRRGGGYHNE